MAKEPWWKRTLLWRSLRCLKAWFKRPIGGHYAVTRSLLAGLRQNGVSFSYNPSFFTSRNVLVLAGLETLRFAIEQKRAGRIKFLAAGPNICVLPSLCANLVADEAVDLFLVNSEWTRRAYAEDCPALRGRIAVWPSGVDAEFWARQVPPRRGHVLLYVKSDHAPLDAVKGVVDRLRMTATTVRYGEYGADLFKKFLTSSECMVYMGGAESQGLALAEAWAMDVPTFVWSGSENMWPIPAYASPAPYLSEQTGGFWGDSGELEAKLGAYSTGLARYTPRQYVLRTLTDDLSAMKLLQLMREYQGAS